MNDGMLGTMKSAAVHWDVIQLKNSTDTTTRCGLFTRTNKRFFEQLVSLKHLYI
jgi:hypothetical protein